MRLPWQTYGFSPSPDDFKWELYNINEDFSQSNDLAAKNPAKLKELQALFDKEARKYNVYPLDSSAGERGNPGIRPSPSAGRTDFTFYPGIIRIPEGSAPDFKSKSYTLTAEVEIPDTGANGVLGTIGGRFGGWALLLLDGKPLFAYAYSNQPQHKYRIASPQPLTPGKHTIVFDFKYDGGGLGKGGTGTLSVDGQQVAQGRIDNTARNRFSLDETLDFGEDTGTPVIEDYADKMPFKFTGTLDKFDVHLGESQLSAADLKELQDSEQRAAIAIQ